MGNFISNDMIEDFGYKLSYNQKMVKSLIYFSYSILSLVIYLYYLYLKN